VIRNSAHRKYLQSNIDSAVEREQSPQDDHKLIGTWFHGSSFAGIYLIEIKQAICDNWALCALVHDKSDT
jgi:hypothetical protein